MARNYRPKQQPEEREEGSGERDQHRDRPRRRRRDFSHLRNEGGGFPKVVGFVALGLLALFGAGFAIYASKGGGGIAALIDPMNRDLPLQGPEFDAMAQRFGEGAFKRMVLRLGFEPKDKMIMAQYREYARKAGVNLAKYYVIAWNYGRTKGATPALIELMTFGDPEGKTRSLETLEWTADDKYIRAEVDHAIERAEFYRKYGR